MAIVKLGMSGKGKPDEFTAEGLLSLLGYDKDLIGKNIQNIDLSELNKK